jgi:hypothetical protein
MSARFQYKLGWSESQEFLILFCLQNFSIILMGLEGIMGVTAKGGTRKEFYSEGQEI